MPAAPVHPAASSWGARQEKPASEAADGSVQRPDEDVKVSSEQEVGSVQSRAAAASLVCLMCHDEQLAPGAGLQLSHSIISEADSQTHTPHTLPRTHRA